MEYLDVVDIYGEPTGEVVERSRAHREGIRHRTSHVWLYRIKNGRTQILLQKRCQTKDSFPGCYDISSAGHIPAGDSYEVSALRELEEELGVKAREEQLIPCGYQSIDWDAEFHGVPYHDRQVTKVFLLRLDDYEEKDFRLQDSEVESVLWIDFAECLEAIEKNTLKHCISLSELALLGLA
ncbi:MAG: NUDIX domain-containing protein [Phascolarctobacterium sp.]|nr:NUDIX domain-containing protein [Phascolarctobacterium sp.]